MHGTGLQLGESAAIAAGFPATGPTADVLICLQATPSARAVEAAAGQIAIGGQGCASQVTAPFTVDVSAEMLKDAGAAWVIVGHSERRQHHGETTFTLATKAKAAWRAGLPTIICTGEAGAQPRAAARRQCSQSVRRSNQRQCARGWHRGWQRQWL